MDGNLILVGFANYSSSGYPTVALFNVNDTEFTYKTTVVVNSSVPAYNSYIKLVKLSSNKAIIFYGNSTTSILANIITINKDNSITVTSPTSVLTSDVYRTRAILLDINKVLLIADSSTNPYSSYAQVITISENNVITTGSLIKWGYSTLSGIRGITTIDSTRALITFGYNSKLYAQVFSISGTTITKGAETIIANDNSGGNLIALDSSRVLVSYRETNYKIKILNITNTTIDSSATGYDTGDANYDVVPIFLLSTNEIYARGLSYNLYKIVCSGNAVVSYALFQSTYVHMFITPVKTLYMYLSTVAGNGKITYVPTVEATGYATSNSTITNSIKKVSYIPFQ